MNFQRNLSPDNAVANLEERLEVLRKALYRQEQDIQYRDKEIKQWREGQKFLEEKYKTHLEREKDLEQMIVDMRGEQDRLTQVCENRATDLLNQDIQLNQLNKELFEAKEAEARRQYALNLQESLRALEQENRILSGGNYPSYNNLVSSCYNGGGTPIYYNNYKYV